MNEFRLYKWYRRIVSLRKKCSGIREYLETIGVDEYNPIEIIKKTQGRMAEDHQWIKMEDVM